MSLDKKKSRLHLFSGKLKSRWTGSFVVKSILSHSVVEISDTKNGNDFKVNWQRLKSFLEAVPVNEMVMGLFDQVYRYLYLFYIPFHASIHFFHTLGTMHEIGMGEGSNMTNITKKNCKGNNILTYFW